MSPQESKAGLRAITRALEIASADAENNLETTERHNDVYREVTRSLAAVVARGTDMAEGLYNELTKIISFDRLRLIRHDARTEHGELMAAFGKTPHNSFLSEVDCRPDPRLSVHWSASIANELTGKQSTVAIGDLDQESTTIEAALLTEEGFRATLAVDLRFGKNGRGVMMLDRIRAGEWATPIIELVEDLAPLCAAVIDRIRVERTAIDSASVYATLFETVGEGVILFDVQTGRIRAVNRRYLQLSGYERDEIIETRNIRDLHPDARNNSTRGDHALVVGHEVKMLMRKSRSSIPVESMRRVFTLRNRPTEILVVRDMRSRLRAEKQIRKLASAIDVLQLGVFLVRSGGRILFVNPAGARMTGTRGRQLVGQPIEAFRTLPTDRMYEGETTIERADGSSFVAKVYRSSFPPRAGSSGGMVEIWTDLTEQKKRDQQLLQADRLAALGQTATSVAHEINNPLAFMMANMEAMVDYGEDIKSALDALTAAAQTTTDDGDVAAAFKAALDETGLEQTLEEVSEITSENIRGAERIRDIVADLRSYARGRDTTQACDMAEVIRNTLAIARNQLRHNAEVKTEIPDDLPSVRGSPGRLEQVLLNLILNAAQAIASDNREVQGLIRIALHVKGPRVICEVEDNGPGIDPDHLAKIFDRFFTTKDISRGTGLGLFISKTIIEEHSGKLAVRSRPGHGTTFAISLPIYVEPEEDHEHQDFSTGDFEESFDHYDSSGGEESTGDLEDSVEP